CERLAEEAHSVGPRAWRERVGPAGTAVKVVDLHLQAARPEPLGDKIQVGVRTEDLLRRGVEVPGDPDERHVRVDGDVCLAGLGGHDGDPFWLAWSSSAMAARTSSRRR